VNIAVTIFEARSYDTFNVRAVHRHVEQQYLTTRSRTVDDLERLIPGEVEMKGLNGWGGVLIS